jgi:hypothetical protein
MSVPRRFRAEVSGRAVAVLFALVVLGTVIFDAARASFWQRRHDMAPVAALLLLLLAVALLRRHRWAWWIFLLVGFAGVPSWVAYHILRHLTLGSMIGLIVGLLELVLLLSSPMRQYVRVGRWRKPQPVPIART